MAEGDTNSPPRRLFHQLPFKHLPDVLRDDLLALGGGVDPVGLVEFFITAHSCEQVVHQRRLFLPGDFGENGFKLGGEG